MFPTLQKGCAKWRLFGNDQLKRFDKTDRRKMVTEHNENLVINKYLGALEAYGSTS